MSQQQQPPDDRECASGTAQAGKALACAGCPNAQTCASGAARGPDPDVAALKERMASVKHKVLVLSGKGGVGKSTFSSLFAFALASDPECETGLMDVDICGPSVPRMLGVMGREVHKTAAGWEPVYVTGNLGVMSVGFMLDNEDTAVIWRGPKKNGLIKQFLRDVEWGALDYLVVDTPPGTSDEHLSLAQYLAGEVTGAIIVTTPQEVALLDVRKEISFCRKLNIPVIGVVENMAGFVCGNCNTESQLFRPTSGGAARMCQELGIPLLASLPVDPRLARACDEGKDFATLYPESRAAQCLAQCVARIRRYCESGGKDVDATK